MEMENGGDKEKKIFKILSIDGGGTKGLYSMIILDEFEKKFCIPNNKLLSDYFHMICGTSVGSLIAVAISLKIPMSVIIEIFEKNATFVFPTGKKRCCFSQLFVNLYYNIRQLSGDKYDVKEYKKILEIFTQDKTMKDVNNLLCIPSYCVSKSKNCVFKNKKIEFENLDETDADVKLIDVILASSAAPTYFPPHKIGEDYYADGGLWANNPSEVGVVESLKYYVGNGKEYDEYALLSIGNLSGEQNCEVKNPSSFFNLTKLSDLFSITINANTDSSKYFVKKMEQSHKGEGIRIEHTEKNDSSSDNFSLDDSSLEFLEILKKWGVEDASKYFNEPKCENIRIFFN
jgi:patatin-like phospholipase/acyl hydrolase